MSQMVIDLFIDFPCSPKSADSYVPIATGTCRSGFREKVLVNFQYELFVIFLGDKLGNPSFALTSLLALC